MSKVNWFVSIFHRQLMFKKEIKNMPFLEHVFIRASTCSI